MTTGDSSSFVIRLSSLRAVRHPFCKAEPILHLFYAHFAP